MFPVPFPQNGAAPPAATAAGRTIHNQIVFFFQRV
jgi:hypothetical protein